MPPLTLRARIAQLERALPSPVETRAQRESRNLLTSWLAGSDEAIELWLDYEEGVQASGSQAGAIRLVSARATVLAIAESLYATLDVAELADLRDS